MTYSILLQKNSVFLLVMGVVATILFTTLATTPQTARADEHCFDDEAEVDLLQSEDDGDLVEEEHPAELAEEKCGGVVITEEIASSEHGHTRKRTRTSTSTSVTAFGTPRVLLRPVSLTSAYTTETSSQTSHTTTETVGDTTRTRTVTRTVTQTVTILTFKPTPRHHLGRAEMASAESRRDAMKGHSQSPVKKPQEKPLPTPVEQEPVAQKAVEESVDTAVEESTALLEEVKLPKPASATYVEEESTTTTTTTTKRRVIVIHLKTPQNVQQRYTIPVEVRTREPEQSDVAEEATEDAQTEEVASAQTEEETSTEEVAEAPVIQYYTSSSSRAKYYYPVSCTRWKSITPANLRGFATLEELQQEFDRTLSPSCTK